MKISQAQKVLPTILSHDKVAIFVGDRGIGKSQLLQQYGKEHGYKIKDMRLGTMSDVGDLRGLPDLNVEELVTRFLPPADLPREEDGPTILFLDEINRVGNKEILQAIFQLILDGKIGEWTKPKNCKIVAAMNPPTEDYDVFEFQDSAFADRFIFIKLNFDMEDWKDFVRNKYAGTKYESVAHNVADFATDQGNVVINGNLADFSLADLGVSPSPRAHCDSLIPLIVDLKDAGVEHNLIVETIGGLVTLPIAEAFMSFMRDNDRAVDIDVVINDYKKAKKNIVDLVKRGRRDILKDAVTKLQTRLAELDESNVEEYKKNAEFIALTKKQEKNIKEFVLDIPADLGYIGVHKKDTGAVHQAYNALMHTNANKQYGFWADQDFIKHFKTKYREEEAKKAASVATPEIEEESAE